MYNQLIFTQERDSFQRTLSKSIATQKTLKVKDVASPTKGQFIFIVQGETKDGNVRIGKNDRFQGLAMRFSFQRERKVGDKWLLAGAKKSYPFDFPGSTAAGDTPQANLLGIFEEGRISIHNAKGARYPETNLSAYRFDPTEHDKKSRGFVPLYTPAVFTGGSTDKVIIDIPEDYRSALGGYDDKGTPSSDYRLSPVLEILGFVALDEDAK
jgi:hypothetical protein